jgi:prevent-host-death family protein
MRYSTRIKPISYFKANAAEVLADLNDGGEPMIITQNGEAKAIVQDIRDYERTQETLAMLKILAMGKQDIEAGRVKPAREVIERLRAELKKND